MRGKANRPPKMGRSPCDGSGVHTWLFLVGPELETDTEVHDDVSYSSSPAIQDLFCHRAVFFTSWIVTIDSGLTSCSLTYSRHASGMVQFRSVQFSSVQSLSCVKLFATP